MCHYSGHCAAIHVCMHVWFSCVLITYVQKSHMHGTAGGWREESSLHMRVLHVQLSLNHRSPSSLSMSCFLSLSLFFLPYPVPTVFLSVLSSPCLLPFIFPLALYIHNQLRVSSPAFLLYPSHPQLSALSLWHEFKMTCFQPPEV